MSALIAKLALFFGSSFIWGLAFVRIKLPPLLGYIVSGVILGPSFSKTLGASIEYIQVIGDIGLLVLMFLAGLELDIDEFTSERNDPIMPIKTVMLQILFSFGACLLIWIIPNSIVSNFVNASIASVLVIGLTGALVILFNRICAKIGLHWRSAIKLAVLVICVFILGISGLLYCRIIPVNSIFTFKTMFLTACLLSLNSSAVVMKLLENRDKKNTKVGTSIIGILIAQDLALIGMLIGLDSITTGISVQSLLFKVGVALGLLWLVKVLTESRPSFLSKALDYIFSSSKELSSVFVIALCFVCSALALLVGLSPIYGAFMIGLLLGNVYKHSEMIIEMCEPISHILMTMFFMWVGAILNIHEMNDDWIPLVAISVLMIIYKYFSNYMIINFVQNKHVDLRMVDPLARVGLSRSCIILCSVLLTQMSEFSIVMVDIVQQGLKAGESGFELCKLLRTASILSLSLGSVATVFMKNTMYKLKYIR